MSEATGEFVNFMRKHMNFKQIKNQKALAAEVGLNPPTISGYLTGSVVMPRDKELAFIRVLGLGDIEELEFLRLLRAIHVERSCVRAGAA